MGNSLGCVKEPKEKAAGKAPLPPKKRVRFKRRRRGKKRAVPAVAAEEEQQQPAVEVAEDDEALKLEAAPRQEGGEDPAGSRHRGALPPGGVPGPGRIVQVKERFQGEVQKAHLVLEPRRRLGTEVAGDSPEEGTTVIARLLENPAEQGCEKAVSRLVQLQRSGTGSSRAVLLPLRQGTDGPWSRAEGLLSPASSVSGGEPAESRELGASGTAGTWGRGDGGEQSSSAVWTCTSAAEPGTLSELSTPSPMVDQLENPSVGKAAGLPSDQAGQGEGRGLPASRSESSFGGTARCSSGYGSDPAKSAGAGGTPASPPEFRHLPAAQGRARMGSSRTDRGMVSVCGYHCLLFWGVLGGCSSAAPRSLRSLGVVISAGSPEPCATRCSLTLGLGGVKLLQGALSRASPSPSISAGSRLHGAWSWWAKRARGTPGTSPCRALLPSQAASAHGCGAVGAWALGAFPFLWVICSLELAALRAACSDVRQGCHLPLPTLALGAERLLRACLGGEGPCRGWET